DVAITDLDGLQLGFSGYGTILIDRDAAGHGWFVDPTPWANEEFDALGGGVMVAMEGSDASSRVDLLTVLLHELGHAATLTHADHGDVLGLMAETLGLAERRLPGLGGEAIADVAA